MTPEDILKAKELVQKFHTIFSKNDLDLGKSDRVKYRIKVTDPVPFKERYRRIPASQYEAVRKHLQEMLDLGAIRSSDSPWCSAVVLVKEKNGELRFCIDLRKLNARTVKNAYSLPRIDETLERPKGSCIFSSLHHKLGLEELSEIVCNYHAKCQIVLKMGTNALSTFSSSGSLCDGYF